MGYLPSLLTADADVLIRSAQHADDERGKCRETAASFAPLFSRNKRRMANVSARHASCAHPHATT